MSASAHTFDDVRTDHPDGFRAVLIQRGSAGVLKVAPWLLIVLGIAAFQFDLAVARGCRESRLVRHCRRVLAYGEAFGHGWGTVLALIAVATLDSRRLGAMPRLAAAGFGSGLAANMVKMIVHRARPCHVPPGVDSALATFQDWLPGPHGSHAVQSFPSAHSAAAVGLAVMLSTYYPRGGALFGVLAGLCMAQRVACGAHFLSDVCFGSAMGWFFALACRSVPEFERGNRRSSPSAVTMTA